MCMWNGGCRGIAGRHTERGDFSQTDPMLRAPREPSRGSLQLLGTLLSLRLPLAPGELAQPHNRGT